MTFRGLVPVIRSRLQCGHFCSVPRATIIVTFKRITTVIYAARYFMCQPKSVLPVVSESTTTKRSKTHQRRITAVQMNPSRIAMSAPQDGICFLHRRPRHRRLHSVVRSTCSEINHLSMGFNLRLPSHRIGNKVFIGLVKKGKTNL